MRSCALGLAAVLGVFAACTDPPGTGALQLYFDVNVDDAPAIGLAGLDSFEVVTEQITAKYAESIDAKGNELVLDPNSEVLSLPAKTQLIPGPHYTLPTGTITQLRVYPSLVRFHFVDGSSADVRVPSGEQTGWKVTGDEVNAPDGYVIEDGHVTGVRLFINVGELFHHNTPQGWMARPTIRSELYNIPASGGYDPDILVVVFANGTDEARINQIIASGGFSILARYPEGPLLFKLKVPVTTNLADAHSYLRRFDEVRAVAPSVRMSPRTRPNEGMPYGFGSIGAEAGWENILDVPTGHIGRPDIVVAEISAASGGINIEHPDLWPNIWLDQGELLPICGSLAPCDPDGDGFITLRDFNNPAFAGPKPADIDGNGRITCVDLLAAGSPYLNGVDDTSPTNPQFVDDLCGWNFITGSNDVLGTLCNPTFESCSASHDTAAAGIMAAVGSPLGIIPPFPPYGPGVGLCWNCRLMSVVVGKDPGGLFGSGVSPDEVKGTTYELLAGMLYARQHGAHVANLSSGADLFNKEAAEQCGDRRIDIKSDAFGAVVKELNSVVAETFVSVFPSTLYTLSAGECGSTRGTTANDGINEGSVTNYYGWPDEAFFAGTKTRQISLTVAATKNTVLSLGGIATYSNFGEPSEIAAPGEWPSGGSVGGPGMLNGRTDAADISAAGTSFAAPAVAGVAALIASRNLTLYGVPDGAALKIDLLDNHTVVDPDGLALIPSHKGLTMTNLR